jgi:hypothetical protein
MLRHNSVALFAIGIIFRLVCSASADDTNVQVADLEVGNTVGLYAKLTNCSEATVTVTATLENMTSSKPLPFTVDVLGDKLVGLLLFTVQNPDQPHHCSFHFDWKAGGMLKYKPKSYIYQLPFRDGPLKVIQGPHGSFSHYQGSGDEEAIDFAMPIGTEVYPARAGTVVAFRCDCKKGGPDVTFKKDVNYVTIKHDDGTFAEYGHLNNNGILVKLGDQVTPGKPIAYSGFTGWTTQPHLHFEVFYNESGRARKTLSVKFRLPSGRTLKPKWGQKQ